MSLSSAARRDCRGREGPKWLEQRVQHDREAELQSRVDRRRVRLATMASGDLSGTLGSFTDFALDVEKLGRPEPEAAADLEAVCEPVPVHAGDAQ